MADMSEQRAESVFSESAQGHVGLMHLARSNSSNTFNVMRGSVVKQYNRLSALESASAEVVLRIKPQT